MRLQGYVLNNYQCLMRTFAKGAPYNAVHLCTIDPSISVSLLESKVADLLQHIKIGSPKVAGRLAEFYVTSSPGVLTSKDSIENFCEREFAYAFSEEELPLRFTLLNANNKNYFCITYNHWVADGFSIHEFIKLVVDDKNSDVLLPFSKETQGVVASYSKRLITSLSKYYRLFLNTIFFAKALRPQMHTFETHDKSNVSKHLFSEADREGIKHLAKQYDVTVNDFFLALIYQTMFSALPNHPRRKWYKPKRDNMVLSVISNTRTQKTWREFNLQLGFFCIRLPTATKQSIDSLLKRIVKQTSNAKKKQLARKNLSLLPIQDAYYKRSSQPFKSYHKHTPVMAGLSNMNFAHQNQNDATREYYRFSPAGAMCPLVFNFTHTFGNLSMTLTASSNRYQREELDKLKERFLNELQQQLVHLKQAA